MIFACGFNSISLTRAKFSRKKLGQEEAGRDMEESARAVESRPVCYPKERRPGGLCLGGLHSTGTQGYQAPGAHGGGSLKVGPGFPDVDRTKGKTTWE